MSGAPPDIAGKSCSVPAPYTVPEPWRGPLLHYHEMCACASAGAFHLEPAAEAPAVHWAHEGIYKVCTQGR
eukprot:2434714-Alexandrium_andersonii.AAC.1